MCLLVFSVGADASLVAIANRDEAHERPTAALSFWMDAPQIAAGRDLRAGGTWFGVTRHGRFAAVTNFRGAAAPPQPAPSRGEIPVDFLRSSATPLEFVRALRAEGARYAGFSTVLAAGTQCVYYSNVENVARELGPGLYGLSNRWLDTPWPKVVRAKEQLATALARGIDTTATLCDLLRDTGVPEDAELPDTGVGLSLERALAASFIVTPSYGTRSTTALILDAQGRADIYEKSYRPNGDPLSESGQRFELD